MIGSMLGYVLGDWLALLVEFGGMFEELAVGIVALTELSPLHAMWPGVAGGAQEIFGVMDILY